MAGLEKILFVDDEPDIRTVATLALETVGGLTVKACTCGAEALEEVVPFAPDLILLDVMMPGMDGPSTLQNLRAIPEIAGTPAVFFTAKTQKNDIEKLQKLGVASVLSKPFDPMTLADEIREVWDGLGPERQPDPTDANIDAKLDALTVAFLTDANSQIATLRMAVNCLALDPGREEVREQLSVIEDIAHKLAGRGGTFGYPEVSAIATKLEDVASGLLDRHAVPASGPGLELAEIEALIADLHKALV